MNVVASNSAHCGHSGLCSVRRTDLTLAIAVVTGKVGLLAARAACQLYLPTNFETIDEW